MPSIRAPFTITARPAEDSEASELPAVGRTTFDKVFAGGPLEGTSVVHFVSTASASGPLAYVALERIEGTLHGRAGAFVVGHDVAPWTELPIWLPEDDEAYALHTGDVSRAVAWGLPTRPLRETVADTWTWVQRVDAGLETPAPAPRAGTGLDRSREDAVLAAWDARAQTS